MFANMNARAPHVMKESHVYGTAHTPLNDGSMILRSTKMGEPVHTHDNIRVKLCVERAQPTVFIKGAEDVYMYMNRMGDYDREYGKLIHLDTKNGILGVETVGVGSINANIVHPRELLKGAILNNSTSVIFVHNHPSGNPQPSREDIAVSGKLRDAFKTNGIGLLDSIVIGKGRYVSLKDAGLLRS